MNKCAFFTIIFMIFLTYSPHTNAFPRDGKVYFDMNAGYMMTNLQRQFSGATTANLKSNGTGYGGSIGGGYYLLDEIRVGASLLYSPKVKAKKTTGTTADSIEETTEALILDAHYDFLTGSKFNPFIMGGIGAMRNKFKQKLYVNGVLENGKSVKTKTKLGYQVGGGLAYHLNTSMDLDFTYKLSMNGKKKKKNQTDQDTLLNFSNLGAQSNIKADILHSFMVGVRYTF